MSRTNSKAQPTASGFQGFARGQELPPWRDQRLTYLSVAAMWECGGQIQSASPLLVRPTDGLDPTDGRVGGTHSANGERLERAVLQHLLAWNGTAPLQVYVRYRYGISTVHAFRARSRLKQTPPKQGASHEWCCARAEEVRRSHVGAGRLKR